jgi:hypothetical protein
VHCGRITAWCSHPWSARRSTLPASRLVAVEGRGRQARLSPSGEGNYISAAATARWSVDDADRRVFYGAGGMQPVPPVSQWQAGLSGPPITSAVVLTTTRPAVISPWRKSRKALSLWGLME